MYCAMEDQLSCETKQQLFITRPDVANLLCTTYLYFVIGGWVVVWIYVAHLRKSMCKILSFCSSFKPVISHSVMDLRPLLISKINRFLGLKYLCGTRRRLFILNRIFWRDMRVCKCFILCVNGNRHFAMFGERFYEHFAFYRRWWFTLPYL